VRGSVGDAGEAEGTDAETSAELDWAGELEETEGHTMNTLAMRRISPLVWARNVYQSEPCARTFQVDLMWYLEHGFVYSTPDYFVMGRPVFAGYSQELITGLYSFPHEACDCWHVYLMAGDVKQAWKILPWDLPLVSFERQNVLRFYRLAAMRRLSGNPSPPIRP
jgi:hypothetical protein